MPVEPIAEWTTVKRLSQRYEYSCDLVEKIANRCTRGILSPSRAEARMAEGIDRPCFQVDRDRLGGLHDGKLARTCSRRANSAANLQVGQKVTFELTLRRVRFGDYRVNFRDGNETTAYYKDNLEDAVNTAVEMARKRKL